MCSHLTLYAPVWLIEKVYFTIIMYQTGVIPATMFQRKTANRMRFPNITTTLILLLYFPYLCVYILCEFIL